MQNAERERESAVGKCAVYIYIHIYIQFAGFAVLALLKPTTDFVRHQECKASRTIYDYRGDQILIHLVKKR